MLNYKSRYTLIQKTYQFTILNNFDFRTRPIFNKHNNIHYVIWNTKKCLKTFVYIIKHYITHRILYLQSSLLQSILRELPISEGRISVHGVISYASQEPWIFSGTIQQNILFGSPMDEERFKRVNKYGLTLYNNMIFKVQLTNMIFK